MTHRRKLLVRVGKKSVLLLLSLTFLFLICVPSYLHAQEFYNKHRWGVVSDAEWAAEPPEEFAHLDLLILRSDRKYEVTDELTIYYHVRIKVLTTVGAREAGQFIVPYSYLFRDISDFKAQTISADGAVHRVKGKHTEKIKQGGFKYKVIQFPAVEPGCILEYRFRYTTRGSVFLNPWYLQGDFFTAQSTLEVLTPVEFEYEVDSFFVEPYVTAAHKETGVRVKGYAQRKANRLTWVAENIPPMDDEPYADPSQDFRARLEFQKVEFDWPLTWQSIGTAWWNVLDLSLGDREPYRAVADSVTAGLTTDGAKSRALYQFVRDGMKTTDAEFEEGGLRSLDKALNVREATALDKNIILAMLHQMAGISCRMIGISRGQFYNFDSDFPVPWAINHLLVQAILEDELVYLDAGAPNLPYGILYVDCIGMTGLQLSRNYSSLIVIPSRDVASSRVDTTFVTVTDGAETTCRLKCVYTGYAMAALESERLSTPMEEIVEKWLLSEIPDHGEPADIDVVRAEGDTTIITCEYTLNGMFELLDEDNLLCQHLHYRFAKNPFVTTQRYSDISFAYPVRFSSTTVFRINEAFPSVLLPYDTTYGYGDGVVYSRESALTDSTVAVTTTVDIHKYRFEVAEYPEIRALFDKVGMAVSDDILFTR